ncbi:Aromatic prenyltransferase protein [Rutstroemia sp. NJR-2017a BBW]|nr:Aromatic prenyltransferase protein [Rutstroemia sp. NJR-2017a BBW]
MPTTLPSTETSPPPSTFNQSLFLTDLTHLCTTLSIPLSLPSTLHTLHTYTTAFHSSAILWRYTSKPHSPLNYRFYPSVPIDTLTPALTSSPPLLSPTHPLLPLLRSWIALYPERPLIQSCDFDAATGGLAKTWLFLRGVRDLGDILGGEAVPEALKRCKPLFQTLGLDQIRHLAVDWTGGTVNLYFLVPGPFSLEQISSHFSLLSRGAPSQEIIEELEKLLPKQAYTFAVTLDVETGVVMRVAYYVMGIPDDRMPDLGGWMKGFGGEAKSWDGEGLEGLVWSFGNGEGGDYWKWERRYCGELRGLLRGWGTPLVEG